MERSVRLMVVSVHREEHMSRKSLAEIAKQMAGIDIAILSTHAEGGEIANRPMSNNGTSPTTARRSISFTSRRAPSRTSSAIPRLLSDSLPRQASSPTGSTWPSRVRRN
jgi:hypothetical protein